MIRGSQLRKRHVVAIVSAITLGTLWACSNQGVGERCERDNGNDDCQSGLICRQISQGRDLCCPPAGQTSSSEECNGGSQAPDANGGPTGEDSGAGADSGNTEDAGNDGGEEDAGSNDGGDAGSDADAEAGA